MYKNQKINTATGTLIRPLLALHVMPAQLGVRVVLLGLGAVLALQRHLLLGLDLFELDLAHVDFGTNLLKQGHTKTHSNIGMDVDVALEICGIHCVWHCVQHHRLAHFRDELVLRHGERAVIAAARSHSHHVGHANLDRDGHANIDRVSGLVLSRRALKDGVGASKTGRSKHYLCVVERERRCVRSLVCALHVPSNIKAWIGSLGGVSSRWTA